MIAIITENTAFRLVLKTNHCLSPKELLSVELIGEQLKDGEVSDSSTYQFFMTKQEINILAEALKNVD